MRRSEVALGGFGVVATLFGVGLLVAPGRLQVGPVERLAALAAGVGQTDLLLALGVATALAVAIAAWPRSGDASGEAGSPDIGTAGDRRFGEQSVAETDRLGADVDTAIREGGEPWQALRGTLAAVTVESYVRATGRAPAEAERAIERGEWTDDPVAAGVVAGGQGLPPGARLRRWVRPRRERRRRIERTVTAIERLQKR